MNSGLVIARVENVSKRFVLHHEKSFKEKIISFRKQKNQTKDFWALENIDLEIEAGTTIGLIGHNGSGKSTLLKILGGILEPTSGKVYRRGRIAPLLELGAGFHPDLSGRENIYLNGALLGLTKAEINTRIDEIIDFSGIESFIDSQVKFYSSGMYVRLAFAIAVNSDPDFLLVDEVLAVGDQPFQQKCINKILDFQSEGRTIALVSHSATQINEMCDSVAVLENGKMIFTGETQSGLLELRSSYARLQQQGLNLVGKNDSPAVDIGEVEVTHNLKSDLMTISVPYVVNQNIDDWFISTSIWTSSDQRIFGVTTNELKISLQKHPGSGVLKIDFDPSSLAPGVYSIGLGVRLSSDELLLGLSDTARFEIDGNLLGSGIVNIKTKGSIDIF